MIYLEDVGTVGENEANDANKISTEEIIANERSVYLVVEPSMIEDERDSSIIEQHEQEEAEEERAQEEREAWISSQFSLWDGAHIAFEELIKDNLNDEKSYDHIETTYIDVDSDVMQILVNELISEAGYSNRVEIGDLFISTEFSAKNGYGGTIKYFAYGIASYAEDTITLIAIE